ncbi:MAG TPA: hypothetical protein VFX30_09025 [bacterium]|nr:hypothetical protein [bacterium]
MKLEKALPTQKEISACSSDLFCSKLTLGMRKQNDLTRLLFITDPAALAGVSELGALIQGLTREVPGFGAPLGVPGQGLSIGPDANGHPSTGQAGQTGLTPSGFGMLDLARKVTLGDFAQDHGWDSGGNLQINGPKRGGSYAENDGGEPSGGEPSGGESSPDAGQSTPDDPSGDDGTSSSGSSGTNNPAGNEPGGDPNNPENDWQYDWSYVYRSPDNQERVWSCCDNGSSFAPGWMFAPSDPRYQPIITNNGSGTDGPRSYVDSSMTPRPSAAGIQIQIPKIRIQPGVTDPAFRPAEQTAVKGDETPDGVTGSGPRVPITKQTLNSIVRFGTGRGAGVIRPEEGGTVGSPTFSTTPTPAPVSCGAGRPCPVQ